MSTWILLRGLTREVRHWGGFPALLQAYFPRCQVVPMELPGNGQLNHQRSPYSIEAMAEFCDAEMLRRGLPGPHKVLAMSLGAMVAVEWAARRPQAFSALVVINTSLRPFSPFYQRLHPSAYPALLRLALPGCTAAQWEKTVLRLTSQHADQAPANLLAQWLSYRLDRPVSHANALRQLWAAGRYRAPVAKPAVPMLILNSAQDRLVSPECSVKLARAWQCPLVQHPSAGHDLPLDDAVWVVRQISRWLNRLGH